MKAYYLYIYKLVNSGFLFVCKSDHKPFDRFASNFDFGTMRMFLAKLRGLTLLEKYRFPGKAGFLS